MFPSLASKRSSKFNSDDDRGGFSNLPEFNGKRFYLFKAKFFAWLRMKGVEKILLPDMKLIKKSSKKKSQAAVNVNVVARAGNAEGAANEVNEDIDVEEEAKENEEAGNAEENDEQEEEKAAEDDHERERSDNENDEE